MAEKLSIEERIERQLVANVAEIDGVARVERWDERGNSGETWTAQVLMDTAQGAEGGDGPSITTVRQEVAVGVLVARGESDSDEGALVRTRWVARLKEKILADPDLVEDGTGERLCNDIRWVRSPRPITTQRQAEFWAIAVFELEYDEDRADPYAGPGVTERTG